MNSANAIISVVRNDALCDDWSQRDICTFGEEVNYIQLHWTPENSIRNTVRIDFTMRWNSGEEKNRPLILFPFVENAFQTRSESDLSFVHPGQYSDQKNLLLNFRFTIPSTKQLIRGAVYSGLGWIMFVKDSIALSRKVQFENSEWCEWFFGILSAWTRMIKPLLSTMNHRHFGCWRNIAAKWN